MTVRDVEEIAATGCGHGNEERTGRRGAAEKDPDTRALEKALHDVLGLDVSIEHKGKGGEVRIRYGRWSSSMGCAGVLTRPGKARVDERAPDSWRPPGQGGDRMR